MSFGAKTWPLSLQKVVVEPCGLNLGVKGNVFGDSCGYGHGLWDANMFELC